MFEYSEYNPFTLTGRPSNHFANVNYAALTQDDRKRFVSRHTGGFLAEIDLSGFHLYLIYTILELEFPTNVYQALKQYYPQDVDPKEYTFKQIYGGIDKSLLTVTPFKEIHELQQTIYNQYKRGELKTFLLGRSITLPGLSSHKIFNYMLQNLETEFNVELISNLLTFLKDKETKLILYNYDSFLFDYCPKDTISIFKDITQIFNGIPFHLKAGTTYGDMKTIII